MTEKEKAMEAKKEEVEVVEGVEATRSGRAFVPQANIYETEDEIVVMTDMPGVDEKSVEIMLEKNELTINGYVEPLKLDDYSLVYSEYEVGDYRRTFILPNEVDREKIAARVKDGVLHLRLPKSASFKARKITVQAG